MRKEILNMTGKILVVSGHADLKNNSFANKIILDRLNEIMPEVIS